MLASTPTGWSGVVTDASPRLASPRGLEGHRRSGLVLPGEPPWRGGGSEGGLAGAGMMGPEIGPSGPSSGGELESPAPAIPSPARPRLGRGVGPPLRPLWCSRRRRFHAVPIPRENCVGGRGGSSVRACAPFRPEPPPRKRRGITFSSLLQTLDEREISLFSLCQWRAGPPPRAYCGRAGEPNEDKNLLHRGVRLTASHGPPSPAEDGGPRRNRAEPPRESCRAWSFCSLEGENRGRGGRAGAEIWGWGGFFRPLGARRRPLDPPPQPPQPPQPFQPRAKLFQRRLAFPPAHTQFECFRRLKTGGEGGAGGRHLGKIQVYGVERLLSHP